MRNLATWASELLIIFFMKLTHLSSELEKIVDSLDASEHEFALIDHYEVSINLFKVLEVWAEAHKFTNNYSLKLQQQQVFFTANWRAFFSAFLNLNINSKRACISCITPLRLGMTNTCQTKHLCPSGDSLIRRSARMEGSTFSYSLTLAGLLLAGESGDMRPLQSREMLGLVSIDYVKQQGQQGMSSLLTTWIMQAFTELMSRIVTLVIWETMARDWVWDQWNQRKQTATTICHKLLLLSHL